MAEYKLKPIEKRHLEIIQKWRNSENTLPFVREYRHLSMEQIESWYTNMIPSDKFEMFLMAANDKLVGVCGLTYINWQNRHADLHFAIYDSGSWIDQKYSEIFYPIITRYAFEELNLNKVYVEVYENDYKKIDFFTDKGFKKDATLRQHYFHEGKYWDSYIFSKLKKPVKEIVSGA
jgi:hypothetical protein